MRTGFVITLTGPDRIGVVEEVTAVILELGGNVESSRMARLGGEFSMLMLVTVPAGRAGAVEPAFGGLSGKGFRINITATDRAAAEAHRGWFRYQIEVHGADHEGIIHEIARGLTQRRINIEWADTGTTRAPVSGAALFSMTALVAVPPDIAEHEWTAELREAAQQANVGITVSPVDVE